MQELAFSVDLSPRGMTDGKDSSPHATTIHSSAMHCDFNEQIVFRHKEKYLSQQQL